MKPHKKQNLIIRQQSASPVRTNESGNTDHREGSDLLMEYHPMGIRIEKPFKSKTMKENRSEEYTLTSSELADRAEVSQQSINYLRKEKALNAKRPKTARAKNQGFLYREDDVRVLKQAKLLGTEKTFIDSVRSVRDKDIICQQASVLMRAFGDIEAHRNQPRYWGDDENHLLEQLDGAIQNIQSLTKEEKGLVTDLIYGNISLEKKTRDENIVTRRILDQAKVKLFDLIFTQVRLLATETA